MKDETLKLCEIFFSVSGEGVMQGKPAVFIRFSGCNMDCHYCDTKYHRTDFRCVSVDYVLNEIAKFGAKYFVITGGEPFVQHDDIFLLIKKLSKVAIVEIETNGTNLCTNIRKLQQNGCTQNVLLTTDFKLTQTSDDYLENFDLGVNAIAPYSEVHFLNNVIPLSLCIKVIVQNTIDIDVAYGLTKKYPGFLVIVSPCFGYISPTKIADYMISKNYQDLKIQIQLHKYLWGEDTNGK